MLKSLLILLHSKGPGSQQPAVAQLRSSAEATEGSWLEQRPADADSHADLDFGGP